MDVRREVRRDPKRKARETRAYVVEMNDDEARVFYAVLEDAISRQSMVNPQRFYDTPTGRMALEIQAWLKVSGLRVD